MRHLWSFLAGVVAAPLTWVLIALGQDGSTRTVTSWAKVGTFNTANLIEPTVYLAVAGILLGLIGTLRVSPLGPMVAGLLLVGPYVGLLVVPFTVRDAVPANQHLFGDELPLLLPLDNGTLFMLGLLLLMATFSVKRWRRWPDQSTDGQPLTAPTDGEERTLTDWPPVDSEAAPKDTSTPTLAYSGPSPEPVTVPAQRQDTESPWSVPPRSSGKSRAGKAR